MSGDMEIEELSCYVEILENVTMILLYRIRYMNALLYEHTYCEL